MQVRRVTKEEGTELLGSEAPAGGTLIPYFDMDGKATGFFRIRFDDYRLPFGAGKIKRYRQRERSGIHI
jgi:hypothetical protein